MGACTGSKCYQYIYTIGESIFPKVFFVPTFGKFIYYGCLCFMS